MVINERTGTVVLGGDVRIGPVAVAHGNLSVRVATRLSRSRSRQPLLTRSDHGRAADGGERQRGDRKLVTLESGTTLADVVRALNTLGVTPRDIIAIMQALKAAGALRAEVVIL